MATTYHGGGSQSPTSISRPLERVFEDAQHTGEIQLHGRKLREFPKLSSKYDLIDSISADLSKNRLSEVPKEICSYLSMEKLNCYHNVIKSIPEAIVQLQSLTYLNLSRNQLSIIPSFISQLQALEVLIACHNKLVSLPEEIGALEKLMELDVSCNEIQHLPIQIGDLKSLKSFNVRRNLLQELPVELSKLNLRKLNISGNRVTKIPYMFRRIETLEDIILHDNPLSMPPAHICTKGKQHIMKYLEIEAKREDKKRMGILTEVEMKRFRKSLPPQQSVSSEEFRNLVDSPDKWKRHTVLSSDSGYSTTDSIEKIGWGPQEELQRQKQEYENKKKIAEQLRIQQEEEEEKEQRRRAAQRIQDEQRALLERQREETRVQEEQQRRDWEEMRRREAEELKRQEEVRLKEEEEQRRKAEEQQRQGEEAKQQRSDNKKPGLTSSSSFKEERRTEQTYRRTTSDQRLPGAPPRTLTNGPVDESPSINGSTPTHPSTDSSPNSVIYMTPPQSVASTNGSLADRSTSLQVSSQRKVKQGDKSPSAAMVPSKVAKPTGDRKSSVSSTTSSSSRSGVPTAKKSNMNQDEEIRRSQSSLKGSGVGSAGKGGEQRLRTIQKEAANNLINRRSSGSTSSEDDRKRSTPTRSMVYQQPPASSVAKSGSTASAASKRSGTVMTNAQVRMLDESFTMRRHHEQHKENSDQIEALRKTISSRLKRSLPDNVSDALSDGVLLCNLINQMRPRSVASVHVPSPAVPKLPLPKCRKNVENFLEACRKMGVPKDQLCEASDILQDKGMVKVALTVAALVAMSSNSRTQPSARV